MPSEDQLRAMREKQIALIRFDYLFRAAWRSIAEERGYRVDMWLGTSSHGTIALRSYLHANGV